MKVFTNSCFKRKIFSTVLFIIFFNIFSYKSNAQSQWHYTGDIDSHSFNLLITSMVKDHSGNIYAAAGGGVLKYNGTKWAELGWGIFSNYQQRPVAIDNSGNVYTAIDSADGSFYSVVKWDGTNWNKIGQPGYITWPYKISSFAVDPAGNLFAAMDGGTIHKWNGVAWQTIFTASNNGLVNSIACDGTGKLYAGGTFLNAGGHAFVNVWDGISWTELGAGNGVLNTALVVSKLITDDQNNVYAGVYSGSVILNNIVKWNGNSWTQLGTGSAALHSTYISALALDGQYNVYATGQSMSAGASYNISKWNGTTWTELGTGVNGLNGINGGTSFSASFPTYAMITDNAGNICAVVSHLINLAEDVDSYVAKWNGTNWFDELGGTSAALHSIGPNYQFTVDKANNLYVWGDSVCPTFQIAGVTQTFISKWDGTSWTNIMPGVPGSGGADIRVDANGNLYGKSPYIISRWTGSLWVTLGTGSSALNANGIINGFRLDNQDNICIGGAFTNNNGKTYVAKWNGNTWTELGTGTSALNGNNSIYDVAVDDAGNIYAAGAFTNASGKKYVAKWNGTSWSELGTGTASLNANDSINTITVDHTGNIYAAGAFKNTSGKRYVAKWNGTNWSELGTGTNTLNTSSSIAKILADSIGNVYALGWFNDGSQDYRIARWNGFTWSRTGTSTDALNRGPVTLVGMEIDASGKLYTTGYVWGYRNFDQVVELNAAGLYTFKGNGNWNDAANWTNNLILPANLPAGSRILINPIAGGQCILNSVQTISPNAIFTVSAGAHFVITGNLINNQ